MTDLKKRIEEAVESICGGCSQSGIGHSLTCIWWYQKQVADFAHKQILDQIRRDEEVAQNTIEAHHGCRYAICAAILAQKEEKK